MATTVGKAFVQIVPSADGIKGSIESVLGGESERAGKSSGSKIAGAMKKVIAAAGVGVAIKKSLEAGADLQQSFGGIETLYGEAADAAKNYAKEAYKVGLSTNTYAEQAVSFGAALKQAYGGDTAQAVEAANTAILDMTDNAAKMGTPIESIQQAYQGFAKQNYTMLDNLKLGYGGTKTEMERLLADAEELSGKEYNLDNLGDVYDAIHVIQENLGLTGVAADEAATTFTGSFEAMKASAENLLASLMLGQDVGPSMKALVESTVTFLAGNLLPAVGNIFKSLPMAIGTAISTGAPLIAEQAKNLITALIDGINNKVPELAEKLPEMVSKALDKISTTLPAVAEKGGELLTQLKDAIVTNAPALGAAAVNIIQQFVSFLGENLPAIAAKAGELVGSLVRGIITHLPEIISAVSKIGAFMIKTLSSIAKTLIKSGLALVKGIGRGIGKGVKSAVGGAMDKVKSSIQKGMDAAKQKVSDIVSKILGFMSFSGLKEKVSDAFDSAKEAVQKKVDEIKGKVEDMVQKIKKFFPIKLGKIFSGWFNKISLKFNRSEDGGNTTSTKTTEYLGKAMNKPYVFKRPTNFMAGEAGDEVLFGRKALLHDIREASGGKSITLNVTNNISGSEDPELFADRLTRRLELNLRSI